jgi:F-type H+-transporting ATPase subunit a
MFAQATKIMGTGMATTGLLASLGILFTFFPSILDSSLCVSYCEGVSPVDLDNDYWKIENIRNNVWHVLFRNVGIKYEVRQCLSDTDVHTSLFELREIGPNYAGVYDDDYLLKLTKEEMLDVWTKNNQGFEYVENGNGSLYLVGSADKKYVFVRTEHSHIVAATMEHFNNIQRGYFHPDAQNFINPNAHGRGSNVLAQVNNTFTDSNSNSKDWPGNKKDNNGGYSNASLVPLVVTSASGYKPTGSRESSYESSEEPNRSASLSEQVNKKMKQAEGQKEKRDIRSPLDQFLIRDLLIVIIPLLASIQFSFTNMTLYLIISMLTVITIYVLPLSWEKIKTSPWFLTTISMLHTVYNFVKSQIQIIRGLNYLPFFFCLFVYILTNNLVGMIPYTFAPTSHFILTFFISFTIVFGCTIIGFLLHKLYYFSLLTPNGCPLGLLPLLVLIETISYLARNVSLGLRLAANILSGHMLLNILSEFTYKIMDTDVVHFFIGLIPLMFIGAFSGLELGIAFIQSQVFVVLSSSYTKDSLELH